MDNIFEFFEFSRAIFGLIDLWINLQVICIDDNSFNSAFDIYYADFFFIIRALFILPFLEVLSRRDYSFWRNWSRKKTKLKNNFFLGVLFVLLFPFDLARVLIMTTFNVLVACVIGIVHGLKVLFARMTPTAERQVEYPRYILWGWIPYLIYILLGLVSFFLEVLVSAIDLLLFVPFFRLAVKGDRVFFKGLGNLGAIKSNWFGFGLFLATFIAALCVSIFSAVLFKGAALSKLGFVGLFKASSLGVGFKWLAGTLAAVMPAPWALALAILVSMYVFFIGAYVIYRCTIALMKSLSKFGDKDEISISKSKWWDPVVKAVFREKHCGKYELHYAGRLPTGKNKTDCVNHGVKKRAAFLKARALSSQHLLNGFLSIGGELEELKKKYGGVCKYSI